jgi:subtilisin family serine protease
MSLHCFLAFLLLCASTVRAHAGLPPTPRQVEGSGAPLVPGEVVIGWQPEAAALAQRQPGQLDVDRASPAWRQAVERLTARTGLAVLDLAPEYGMARLAVPTGQERTAAARLAALPWVKHAAPNYIAHAAEDTAKARGTIAERCPELVEGPAEASPFDKLRGRARQQFSGIRHAASYPNDPRIGDQWHMRRIGAPAAWDLTFGSYSLIVAVIDSGVDLGHPEFAGRLRPGYDYVNQDDAPNDDYGHGTHVTGLIAAAANNGAGVAGLAANVNILPLKVLDAQGAGAYYNIKTAIRRAADSGVQVINLSLGGLAEDPELQDAVNYALSKNIFVAAAAGNCAGGGDGCGGLTNPIYYPAAYPGVVAVAASDHFDNWASYSGFKYYVALAAPGGVSGDQVLSTLPGGYGLKSGTSMATAQVSAAAALALTFMPAATYTQVADILKNTADKVGPYTYVGGRNDFFGAGRLNVGRAVRWAYPPSLKSPSGPYRFLLGAPVTQASSTLPILNDSDQPVTWQASELTGATWLTLTPGRGVTTFSAPDTLALRAGPTALGPGEYDAVIQIRALSPATASFLIFATLKVAGGVRQHFLPLVTQQVLTMNWIDPAAGGNPIYPTDELPYRVGLPFPIPFYGQSYNAVSVSFKGYVSFTQPGSGSAVAQSACLPTAALPNDAIYVLWQNWDPALGGQVFVQQPDSDRFAITWFQVRRFPGDLPHSFQLIFFRDGRLALQYRTVQTPVQGTIGNENWDGTIATQLACNGAGVLPADGDAFALSAQLPW